MWVRSPHAARLPAEFPLEPRSVGMTPWTGDSARPPRRLVAARIGDRRGIPEAVSAACCPGRLFVWPRAGALRKETPLPRTFTGIKPTGPPHLGNNLGINLPPPALAPRRETPPRPLAY